MRALLFHLLVVLAGLAPQASAQVHRCEQGGRVTFSDQPCESGAKASRKDYAPAGAGASIDMQIALKYYPVEGHDYDSLTNSLRARGPQGFHGFAQWRVSYEYGLLSEQDSCRITTVLTRVTGEILMPRWVDESSAPRGLQRRWADYLAALKRHEDGHIQHGRELALLVKEKLLGIGPAPCDQIRSRADSLFGPLYERLKTRDAQYDARTGHGATQGAFFQREP